MTARLTMATEAEHPRTRTVAPPVGCVSYINSFSRCIDPISIELPIRQAVQLALTTGFECLHAPFSNGLFSCDKFAD